MGHRGGGLLLIQFNLGLRKRQRTIVLGALWPSGGQGHVFPGEPTLGLGGDADSSLAFSRGDATERPYPLDKVEDKVEPPVWPETAVGESELTH